MSRAHRLLQDAGGQARKSEKISSDIWKDMIKRLSDIYGKPFYHAFIEIYTVSLRLDTINKWIRPGRPQGPGRSDNQTSDREPFSNLSFSYSQNPPLAIPEELYRPENPRGLLAAPGVVLQLFRSMSLRLIILPFRKYSRSWTWSQGYGCYCIP